MLYTGCFVPSSHVLSQGRFAKVKRKQRVAMPLKKKNMVDAVFWRRAPGSRGGALGGTGGDVQTQDAMH